MQVSSGAALVLALLGATLAPGQPAGKPTPNPAERAAAIVTPAVVYLELDWQGRVRSRATGTLVDEAPVTATTRCTAFAVSGDGYLVTAGQCVDPAAAAAAMYAALADRLEGAGRLTPTGRADFLAGLRTDAEIEGTTPGTAVDLAVYAQRGTAIPGRTTGETIATRVVDATAGDDVALLKVDKANQPMITIGDAATPAAGTPVFAIGYPLAQPDEDRATTVNRPGTVLGPYTIDKQTYVHTDAPATNGMAGAPLSNLDGAAIGVLSRSTDGADGPPLLAAPASAITAALERNGVHNELGRIDRDYRAGLDEFYAGRYTEAIAKFDAVLAIMPSHATAQEYQQRAVSLRQSEGEPRDIRLLLYGGGAGVLVLLALAILGLRHRRRRRATEPADELATEPASGRATGPVSGRATEPASGRATDPAAEKVDEPAAEPEPSTGDQEDPGPHPDPPPPAPPSRPVPALFEPGDPRPQPEPPAPGRPTAPPIPTFSASPPPAVPVAEPAQPPAPPTFAEPVPRRPPPPSLRYCPNCGHANGVDVSVCGTCGRTT